MKNMKTTPIEIKSFQEYLNILIVRLLVSDQKPSLQEIQRVIHLELLNNSNNNDKISIDAKKFLILLENETLF